MQQRILKVVNVEVAYPVLICMVVVFVHVMHDDWQGVLLCM